MYVKSFHGSWLKASIRGYHINIEDIMVINPELLENPDGHDGGIFIQVGEHIKFWALDRISELSIEPDHVVFWNFEELE